MDRARTRRGWSVPADRSGVPARVTPHDISPRRTVTALRSHGRPKIDRRDHMPSPPAWPPLLDVRTRAKLHPRHDPQAARRRSTVCPPTTHPGRPGPTPAHQGPRRPTRADPRPRRPTRAHVDPPAPHVGPLGPTSAHSGLLRPTPSVHTRAAPDKQPQTHAVCAPRQAAARTPRPQATAHNAGGTLSAAQPERAAPSRAGRRRREAGGHPVQRRARVAVASRARRGRTPGPAAPGSQWRRGHVAGGHPVQQRPGRSGVAGTSRAGTRSSSARAAVASRARRGRAGSTAAGASATAAALGGGRGHSSAAAGDRDGGEQLDRVVVALWTGGGRGRLAHRAADLERVATGSAPELVTRHWQRVGLGSDRNTRGGPTQP